MTQTYTAKNGETLSQQELDDLAVGVLSTVCNFVHHEKLAKKRKGEEPSRFDAVSIKRRKEFGERLAEVGPEILLRIELPGGRGGVPDVAWARKHPASLASRLFHYGEQIIADKLKVKKITADLAHGMSISDELCFAARVLDRPSTPENNELLDKRMHRSIWLGNLNERAQEISQSDLYGPSGGKDNITMPYGGISRSGKIGDMKRLVQLAAGGFTSSFGEHGIAVWLMARKLHDDLSWPNSATGWHLLGHFDTWPAGLVSVQQVPTNYRGSEPQQAEFRVAVRLSELVENTPEELIDLLTRRCVRDPELMRDVRYTHIGPWCEYPRRDASRMLGEPDEVLILLLVSGDATALMQAHKDGTLVIPERPKRDAPASA